MPEYGIIHTSKGRPLPVYVEIGNSALIITPAGPLPFAGNRLVTVEYAMAAADGYETKMRQLENGDPIAIQRYEEKGKSVKSIVLASSELPNSDISLLTRSIISEFGNRIDSKK